MFIIALAFVALAIVVLSLTRVLKDRRERDKRRFKEEMDNEDLENAKLVVYAAEKRVSARSPGEVKIENLVRSRLANEANWTTTNSIFMDGFTAALLPPDAEVRVSARVQYFHPLEYHSGFIVVGTTSFGCSSEFASYAYALFKERSAREADERHRSDVSAAIVKLEKLCQSPETTNQGKI
jgi:hypothetical protein